MICLLGEPSMARAGAQQENLGRRCREPHETGMALRLRQGRPRSVRSISAAARRESRAPHEPLTWSQFPAPSMRSMNSAAGLRQGLASDKCAVGAICLVHLVERI
jgi:hypothetical protein